ncbi:superoxide dismutase family protein [Chitiniphilus eburneus]|uniref:Superoxide dismutase family protein n=1 Tax=Chitiniphilus eburneus TaxID=2571148 RepID=A0A4U0QHU0_9NEIS|nr:superoxide dismutase family protein [Chitiniphilus eburneus]TJZ75504.1 superoxide dismutase family protein [Chitiniphilus eburneus]
MKHLSLLLAAAFSLPALAATAPPITQLSPASGSQVRGGVTLIDTADGLRVAGEITGLSPGAHGFHVHVRGNCSAPDASSAGDHYNPDAHPHGDPDPSRHHAGDLGNIEADAQGRATVAVVVPGLTAADLKGRALVVHDKPDDLRTQPSGASGDRIACGVIH